MAVSYLDLAPYLAALFGGGGVFAYLRVLEREKTKRIEIEAKLRALTIVCTLPQVEEKATVEEIRKLVIAKTFELQSEAVDKRGDEPKAA